MATNVFCFFFLCFFFHIDFRPPQGERMAYEDKLSAVCFEKRQLESHVRALHVSCVAGGNSAAGASLPSGQSANQAQAESSHLGSFQESPSVNDQVKPPRGPRDGNRARLRFGCIGEKKRATAFRATKQRFAFDRCPVCCRWTTRWSSNGNSSSTSWTRRLCRSDSKNLRLPGANAIRIGRKPKRYFPRRPPSEG